MESHSLSRLGFWSAVLTALFSTTFSISGLLGMSGILTYPWDPIIPDGASLLLAVAFLVMMICIHRTTPVQKMHWSQIGVALATIYAALVSIVYFVICTVVVPLTMRGEVDKVAVFQFDQAGSFMQAVDGLGYFFMSLATWFAAPAFARTGQERWLRRLFTANGMLGIAILLAYMPLVIPQPYALVFYAFGVGWIFSVPACAVAAALHFRRAAVAAVSHRQAG